MNRLEGKTAVVSGAAGGIGLAIAQRLVAEGATVFGGDVKRGDPGFPLLELDVREGHHWRRLISAATHDAALDIVVNVAGITGWEPLHRLGMDEWDTIVAVNQTGTFLGMKYGIQAMIESGRPGAVLNIASIFGTRAVPDLAAYHASKAAVVGLTRNAAVTYAPHAIRVNAIAPGWIATPMTATQPADMTEAFISSTPMQRGGCPEDIAAGAAYLVSDEASYVTGAVLPIDGGYLAR